MDSNSANPQVLNRKELSLIAFLAGIATPAFSVVANLSLGALATLFDLEFPGITGLALALVYSSLAIPIVLFLSFLPIAYLLKRRGYPHTFLVTLFSVVSGYQLIQILNIALHINDLYLFSLMALTYPITFNTYHSIFNLWKMRLMGKIIVSVVMLTILAFGNSAFARYDWLRTNREGKINRGFEVYGITADGIDIENLGGFVYRGELSHIPYSESEIKTPLGIIGIKQAGQDDIINSFLSIPENCNYIGLMEYIGPFGSVGETDKGMSLLCDIVYRTNDRILVRPMGDAPSLLYNDAAYIAKIGDTVILFDDTGHDTSTNKQFTGGADEALPYIIDFVKNARIITNEELGL